jgi:Cys-tRNA(Pro)/Cys-tRNA(Cys) deacylase
VDAHAAEQPPVPQALEEIDRAGFPYRVVRTVPAGSVEESAELQGIRVDQVLRSLVVRRGADDYVFILVPGGREIDWAKLRAHLGVRRLSLPDREDARSATGYERGAITPFGSLRRWPVVMDRTALEPDRVAIGAGARGVNAHISPEDLRAYLRADVADVSKAADPAGH